MAEEENIAGMFQQTGEALASSSSFADQAIRLANEAIALESHIASLNELLTGAKAQLHDIVQKQLPETMAAIGSSNWTHDETGLNIKVDDFVAGSLPKDEEKRKAAVDWLVNHEAGDLLKTEVTLTFAKSEHNLATNVVEYLKTLDIEPVVQSGVHPQTLMAFARERLKKGEDIDTEVLGLFTGRKAKIKQK